MPVTAFLPAIIAAGGQVAGTAIASHGNTSAANTQAQASTKAAEIQAQQDKAALDFAKAQYGDQYRQYEQQQANLGPYRDLGYSSLTALAGGLNLPEPAAPTSVPDTLVPPGLAALNAMSNAGLNPNAGFNGQPLRDPNGNLAPSASSTPAPWNMGGTRAQQLLSQFKPTTAAQTGGMVTLRAPDGTVQSVPVTDAAHYISQGAKPVTSGADVNAGAGQAL